MTILGAVFLPDLPPERLRDVAQAADDAGLAELWLWEDCFRESGIASAAAALAWTRYLRVGVGLLPVPLRNVALTAMEIATLHRLFPDRVAIGVGHGVLDWMAQVGARVESPLTLLREYVTALRALLHGQPVSATGRYVRLDGVALDWPPLVPPALLVGATGPTTVRLSGELADGTILTARTSPAQVTQARHLVQAGRAAGRRTGGPHQMIVYVLAATGPDATARIAAEQRRWGGEWAPDSWVAGDAAAVAEAVRRWAAAGADSVVLQPTSDTDPEQFVRFVGRHVRPLVP